MIKNLVWKLPIVSIEVILFISGFLPLSIWSKKASHSKLNKKLSIVTIVDKFYRFAFSKIYFRDFPVRRFGKRHFTSDLSSSRFSVRFITLFGLGQGPILHEIVSDC